MSRRNSKQQLANPDSGAVSPDSPRRRGAVSAAICIALLVMVGVVYGQTLGHDFSNYDDNDYVYENEHVTNGITFSSIGWAFAHFHADNYHPLTTISHMLDCQMYGLQPWGHHLTNLLLHGAASVFLFLALRALTGALWPNAVVSALFAVHPLHVESVAWIAERKDVLSGVFFALTLWAYAQYTHRLRKDRQSFRRYLIMMVPFALGLMCKPTLVTLPFVLLLLDYWPLARLRAQWSIICNLVAEKIPLFVLSAASCAVTLVAQKPALSLVQLVPFQYRFANALISYAVYLWQTLWPAHLAVLYPYPQDRFGRAQLLGALLFLWIVTIGAFVWRKQTPFLLVGWLWFCGMLVPMIGLVQVGSQSRADRYNYLPGIGIYILVTWGMLQFATRTRSKLVLKPLTAIVLGLLGVRSFFQTQYWQNSESLWRHTIEITSRNYIGENSLANALFEAGRLDDAIVHYEAALAINPDYPPIHSNLGNVFLRQHLPDQAIPHLRKAIAVSPTYAEAYNNLGSAFMEKGQFAEAIADYAKAVQFKPDYADAHNNLGVAHLQQGDIDAAIKDYEKAAAINPASSDIEYNLGNAYARRSDWKGAIAAYTAAIRSRPGSAKIHNNLGVALKGLGRLEEANKEFTEALEINPNYPEAHCNLARVLAERGDRDRAMAHLNEALRLRPGDEETSKQLRELGASGR